MPDERLPKKVFYGEVQEGKRSQGGQRKRYKDTLRFRHTNGVLGTDCTGAIKVARSHQHLWNKEISEAERKRRERKAKTNGPPADSMTLTCSACNRQFRARIGLVSHQRTHQHTRTYLRINDGISHK